MHLKSLLEPSVEMQFFEEHMFMSLESYLPQDVRLLYIHSVKLKKCHALMTVSNKHWQVFFFLFTTEINLAVVIYGKYMFLEFFWLFLGDNWMYVHYLIDTVSRYIISSFSHKGTRLHDPVRFYDTDLKKQIFFFF